jgi:hypothetical protein
MSRVSKIILWVIVAAILLVVPGISWTIGWRPFLGPRERPLTKHGFQRTPERRARGKYLAGLAHCMHCHSQQEWSQPGAPIVPGSLGAGQIFPAKGLPGRIVASNLTPDPETGLGNWTDDEIARAIREGVDRNGRALFPLMPYEHFRHMSDEDIASLVVYLRSLPPVRNPLPKTQIDFPARYMIQSLPQPISSPVPPPDSSNPLKRGAYLVEIGQCTDCHTPPDKDGKPNQQMEFGGGRVMQGPWGRVASANITPDATGIGHFDLPLFEQAMRTGYVGPKPLNPIMPWPFYHDLTDQDLSDMFTYLKTLKPVRHIVDNTQKPTFCRLCNAMHGAGDQN